MGVAKVMGIEGVEGGLMDLVRLWKCENASEQQSNS